MNTPFVVQEELTRIRESVAAIAGQLADQHKALLRFLGYMKDRLPETTAWDLFVAAALPLAYQHTSPDQTVAEHAARIADWMLAERTKREQAALEARKKPDKE